MVGRWTGIAIAVLALAACGQPAPKKEKGAENPSRFKGSYAATCRNIAGKGGMLSAECPDTSGIYRPSTIEAAKCIGDIGNQSGFLVCNSQDGVLGGPLVKR